MTPEEFEKRFTAAVNARAQELATAVLERQLPAQLEAALAPVFKRVAEERAKTEALALEAIAVGALLKATYAPHALTAADQAVMASLPPSQRPRVAVHAPTAVPVAKTLAGVPVAPTTPPAPAHDEADVLKAVRGLPPEDRERLSVEIVRQLHGAGPRH